MFHVGDSPFPIRAGGFNCAIRPPFRHELKHYTEFHTCVLKHFGVRAQRYAEDVLLSLWLSLCLLLVSLCNDFGRCPAGRRVIRSAVLTISAAEDIWKHGCHAFTALPFLKKFRVSTIGQLNFEKSTDLYWSCAVATKITS